MPRSSFASSRATDGIDRVVVAGYSLGGNLALRLAGTARRRADLPSLKAVCAVSPVLELEACVRALERRIELRLPVELRAQPEDADAAQERVLPRPVRPRRASIAIRTVRQFDAAYTAPFFGFASAEDYYHRAAALRVIEHIQVPALVITAEDDPFVPVEPFRDPKLTGNPNITLVVTTHGGHCGFLAERGRSRRRRLLGRAADRRVRESPRQRLA